MFEEPITFSLPAGPFVILGGNALGKTTILQATIFGIAGGADRRIEEEKRFRWSAEYFRKRLLADTEAEVEVEFFLGDLGITVRRSVRPERICGVQFSGSDWIHDTELASAEYESAIQNVGRYASFDDFRYVVHRLCYLGENRRSLLWDQRAQLRTVMLVCADAEKEADFYRVRRELTSADTDMRHRHVDITHLEARIQRAEQSKKHQRTASRRPTAAEASTAKKIAELRQALTEVVAKRGTLVSEIRLARSQLHTATVELERLQEHLSRAEDAFVLTILRDTERASDALALHKLLIHHRCPYCAQIAESLAADARRHVGDGDCPICGQTHIVAVSPRQLRSLRGTVATRTQQRDATESAVVEAEASLLNITEDEMGLRAQLDSLVERLPRVPAEEDVEFTTSDVDSLRRTLDRYRRDHQKLQIRREALRSEAEARFDAFQESCARNLQWLGALASEYGAEFLGAECEFVQTAAEGELHNFSFFVPRFAEQNREDADSCSESERFFLDIAFRQALIALAGQLASTSSTFVCETPESALDLAYTDNVAEMFLKFARKSFSLLLTANIQAGGVAGPLLRRYPPNQRQRHAFDLLDRVTLTTVQHRKRGEFKRELRKIMEATG